MSIGATAVGAAAIAALDFPLPFQPIPCMDGPLPVRAVMRVLPWNAYLVLDVAVFPEGGPPIPIPPAMAVPYLKRRPIIYEQSVLPPRVRDAIAGRLTSKLGIPYSMLGQIAYALLELPVTPDEWWVPFSNPRWSRKPLLPIPRMAVEDPVALTLAEAIDPAVFQPPNIPRWSRKPLLPLPRNEAIDPAVLTLKELITSDKWFTPLDLPRWSRKPLLPVPQGIPDQALLFSLFPADPVALLRPWYTPLELPRWSRKPLLPVPRFDAIDPFALTIPSPTFPETLEAPWPFPAFRSATRRKDTHQLGYAILTLTEAQRAETVFVPVLDSIDRPTRPRLRLRAYGYSLLDLDAAQAPEVIYLGEWDMPLSLPVRRRPGPRLPWTLAAEQYEPTTFALPLIIRLLRPMLEGGMWTGGLQP